MFFDWTFRMQFYRSFFFQKKSPNHRRIRAVSSEQLLFHQSQRDDQRKGKINDCKPYRCPRDDPLSRVPLDL